MPLHVKPGELPNRVERMFPKGKYCSSVDFVEKRVRLKTSISRNPKPPNFLGEQSLAQARQ